MSDIKEVLVPDFGEDSVEVIEICVAVGDSLDAEDSIVTVESDKASMDIPAPFAGDIAEICVAVGDKISEGTLLAKMKSADESATDTGAATGNEVETIPEVAPETAPVAEVSAPVSETTSTVTSTIEVTVPDIGGDENVDVIEILVAVGDTVDVEEGLVTLETDKASMDVPSPQAGKITAMHLNVGDKVSEGSLVVTLETASVAASIVEQTQENSVPVTTPVEAPAVPAPKAPPVPHHPSAAAIQPSGKVHASPSVRRLAREFGVDLTLVNGSGNKGRIVKEDVQSYVKYELSRPKLTPATATTAGEGGLQVLAAPKVDFSKFGEIEEKPLTRIQKLSGPNLHRNWVTIPHVTQFEEADITEMESFRKEQNVVCEKRKLGFKITPLVFMMKAVADALQAYPTFNSSLSADGESLIIKKYFHIGIAVDTPNGLVVPVVRDVDQKGVHELSKELMDISAKARDGKLKAADMQGSCFTISSLGGIGGTAFTPIVNAPDVAILGVSKSEIKPKWNGKDFEPRLMLPLSLSYDHRVIDGALAARFAVHIKNVLGDLRQIIL